MGFLVPLFALATAGGAVYSAVQSGRSARDQRRAADRAAQSQKQAQERQRDIQKQQQESQKEQQEKAQQEAMLISDDIRSRSTRRGRRSLLAGDELGVDATGVRGTTG